MILIYYLINGATNPTTQNIQGDFLVPFCSHRRTYQIPIEYVHKLLEM